MLNLDNNSSNSAQESSSDKEPDDSSDDFSANKPSTRKTTAQHQVFHVHTVLEEVSEQGHVLNKKIIQPT